MRKLKRFICALLVCALLATEVIVAYAADASTWPQGDTNVPPLNDNTPLHNPNILVRLDIIRNTVTDSDRKKIESHNKAYPNNYWDECSVSLVDKELYTFPSVFVDAKMPKSTALIAVDESPKSNYVFIADGGKKSKIKFANTYSSGTQSSHTTKYKPDIVSSKIKNNEVLYKKFMDGKLTWSEVKSLASGSDIQSSISKFCKIWRHTEDAAKAMNSMFESMKGLDPKASAKVYYNNLLTYLDFLITVNAMCDNAHKDKIEVFLRNLNQDGTSQFVIVNIAAATRSQYAVMGGTKYWQIFTLPTFYSMISGKSTSKYMNTLGKVNQAKAVDQTKGSRISYNDDPAGWTKAYRSAYEDVSKGRYNPKYSRLSGNNKDIIWWRADSGNNTGYGHLKTATVCLPTDMFGLSSGNIGYTYFSTANMYADGGGSVFPLVDAEFSLKASTEQGLLTTPGNVSADLTINLKQQSRNKNKMNSLFLANKILYNDLPDLKIELTQSGPGTSPAIPDVVKGPKGATKTAKTITFKDVTKDQMKAYLSGEKKIEITDSGIYVDGEVENKYTAKVTLIWERIEVKFEATGKVVESKYVASDTVNWNVGENKLRHYYSEPEQPYVEIKEGSPGGETFEAMAGVPTTEDLYVGFGATEFMVNVDLEKKESSGTRTYTYTYTGSQCIEQNTKCSYSCPGHEVTIPDHVITPGKPAHGKPGDPDYRPEVPEVRCPGATASGSCSSGPVTVTASCGHKTESKTFNPLDPCEWNDGSRGCVHNQQINQAHPHSHDFVGTVTQPINQFTYMDILALDLWQLDELNYQGNDQLLSDPIQVWDPNTGYSAFYSQEGYVNNNGRLRFSLTLDDGNKWGNTAKNTANGSKLLKTELDQLATTWMNQQIAGKTVYLDVISDFLNLTTTEGYQSVMYHSYKSDTVPLTNATFALGSDRKSIPGVTITFPHLPTAEEMWEGNSESASSWTPDHITRSGYNGKYNSPCSKWSNANAVSGSCNVEWLADIPNRDAKGGSTAFATGFANTRLTRMGLNIIDSMDTDTKEWSDSDELFPVKNGEWYTGEASLAAHKKITFKKTLGGTDWTNDTDNSWRVDVPYADGTSRINDIVIHNPVSVQNYTVISNDKKYDRRTTTSLEEGGDPVKDTSGCPNDSSCQFQKLTCNTPFEPHNDSCYETVEVSAGCTGEMNTHVHTSACDSGCTGELNSHSHTDACKNTTQKILVCQEPHHYEPGESVSRDDPTHHYDYGDSRCWTPCGDDNKHKSNPEIDLGNGQVQSPNKIFINLDREFKIYAPDTGDFAQQPGLHGILATTNIRGMGYTDNMNTYKWTRNKYVTLPCDVMDRDGNIWFANTLLDLYEITPDPDNEDMYTFYCLLDNDEAMGATVEFEAIASNADEEYYNENDQNTNRERDQYFKDARHTAYKSQRIDIVGSIGSLTINDVGDMRFAELFKKPDGSGEWLIDNVVHKVDVRKPNKVVSDVLNVRGDRISEATKWQSAYGNTASEFGGKSFEPLTLPLTAMMNPIEFLRNQPMRPGYDLYMDCETIGNYYGENRSGEEGVHQDSNLYYKMQVTPKYWLLNKDNNTYEPLDVYSAFNSDYTLVADFDKPNADTKFYLYVDWANESARRNYVNKEKEATVAAIGRLSADQSIPTRYPLNGRDVIGTAGILFLNDLNRTFMGSSKTYGVSKNDGTIPEDMFNRQGQRWQFTLGLPSSSVFVRAGHPCVDDEIKYVEDTNGSILCTLEILVKGSIWTLEYDGTAINNTKPDGMITVDNKEYKPKDPTTDGGLIDKEIIVVEYDNKHTAADDLRTEGSH